MFSAFPKHDIRLIPPARVAQTSGENVDDAQHSQPQLFCKSPNQAALPLAAGKRTGSLPHA